MNLFVFVYFKKQIKIFILKNINQNILNKNNVEASKTGKPWLAEKITH